MFVRAIKEKSDKEIMREIQAIMRQIASCITYLPCLDEPCKGRNRHPVASCIFAFLLETGAAKSATATVADSGLLSSRTGQACSTCWPTRTRTSTLRAPGSRVTPSSSTTRRWLSCTPSTPRYSRAALSTRYQYHRSGSRFGC